MMINRYPVETCPACGRWWQVMARWSGRNAQAQICGTKHYRRIRAGA